MNKDVQNKIIYKSLLSRVVEETFLSLFNEGKLFGTVHTCIGQEFTGAVLTEHLRKGDTVFSNHRCHGHFLSFTDDVDGLVAELMGRETGVCGGKGGSQHLCKDGFFSNGIQGGIVPVATGLALGHKTKREKNISVVFIGDGTLGEGAIYEAFNIASKWSLPLLIVLEDNGYAQSTNKLETLAGSISQRAQAFDFIVEQCSIWDWQSYYDKSRDMIVKIRETSRPGFLIVDSFRLKAHSKGDDNRPRELVEKYEKIDPLNVYKKENPENFGLLSKQIEERVSLAVKKAEFSSYSKNPVRIESEASDKIEWLPSVLKGGRHVKDINKFFNSWIEKEDLAFFLGEDIRSPYGGAFKVTDGLSNLSSERVFNTPISESCIVGIGSGMSMMGYKPVIEIMFGDFLGLAFDQILNHAAKFHDMYNGQVGLDFYIRTPMGGRRGYGPTHSQSIEKHFMGIPGLRIVALNNLINPSEIYSLLFSKGNPSGPTLIIENKILYGANLDFPSTEGFELLRSNESVPAAFLKARASKVHITLIGYGGMASILTEAALRLFEEADIIAQVFCPTQIYPFQIKPYLNILMESDYLVFAEEGQSFGAFSSEIISQIQELVPKHFKGIARVSPPACCIPACAPLEKEVLPDVRMVIDSCIGVVNGN